MRKVALAEVESRIRLDIAESNGYKRIVWVTNQYPRVAREKQF